MTPRQGDIVLIPVPFSDLSSGKRRPVIVLSSNAYNDAAQDMVVVAMTSNPRSVPYSIPVTSADLQQGRLNRPGRVRADKVYNLAQRIAVRRFGRVRPAFLDGIVDALRQLTARES